MRKAVLFAQMLMLLGLATVVHGHCQIPCGIYNDDARFERLLEDVTTIQKSVVAINKQSAADKKDYNQLVRWVTNKENHADHIQEVMLDYFLAQRIKATMKNYEKNLVAVHKIIVLAMKAKQTSNEKVVADLEQAVKDFQMLYNKSK